jgi:hypothetical protein
MMVVVAKSHNGASIYDEDPKSRVPRSLCNLIRLTLLSSLRTPVLIIKHGRHSPVLIIKHEHLQRG